MTCEADNINIELCKKNCRTGVNQKILYSYGREQAEEMFIGAVADYIRLSADSGFPNTSIGTATAPDSTGILLYGGKTLTITIPANPTVQATVTLDATSATPNTLDELTVPDGTTTLTITVVRSPASFTVLFDNASGDDYIFDSTTGQISLAP